MQLLPIHMCWLAGWAGLILASPPPGKPWLENYCFELPFGLLCTRPFWSLLFVSRLHKKSREGECHRA